jgi:hypothetical protein
VSDRGLVFYFVITLGSIAGFTVLHINMGCGPTGKAIAIDLTACAAGEFPGAVADVTPEVVTALSGSNADWNKEIVSLETHGVKFAICAIQAAIAELSKKNTGEMSPTELERHQTALKRGRDYLLSKGVK